MDVTYNKLFKLLIDKEMKKNGVCKRRWYQSEYPRKTFKE